MVKRSTAAWAGGGLGALGLLAGAAAAVARVRWSRAFDETEGRPMELPNGEEIQVRTSDGAELAVIVSGPPQVAPIVLAHGWTADRRVWSTTARLLLAEGRRVVLYDQRGHGRSTVGSAPLDLDTLADDLKAVLEHIDARDAVVGGHSMGGMTVQRFAAAHKDVLAERVAALALVSTAPAGVGRKGRRGSAEELVMRSAIVNRAVAHALVGPFLMRSTVGRRVCLSHLQATCETFATTSPDVRVGFLRAMASMDLTGGLSGITVPTVVVSGELDMLTLHRHSKTIASLIPGAELIALPGAGHQLVFEAPGRLATILGALADGPVD